MRHSNPKGPGKGSVNAELPDCSPSMPTTSPQLNLSFSCKALISSQNMSSLFSFLLSYQITGWPTFSQLWVSLNSRNAVALNPRSCLEWRNKLFGYHWVHPVPSMLDNRTCPYLFPFITIYFLSDQGS